MKTHIVHGGITFLLCILAAICAHDPILVGLVVGAANVIGWLEGRLQERAEWLS